MTLRAGENSIRFRPALDITPEVIDEVMGIHAQILQEARERLVNGAGRWFRGAHAARVRARAARPRELLVPSFSSILPAVRFGETRRKPARKSRALPEIAVEPPVDI